MICRFCKFDNISNTIYCSKCGKQIGTTDDTVNFMEPSLKYVGPIKLHRGRDRWIAGVCSGISDYYNIDVILIRALFVFLSLIGTTGVWLYLILLAIIPESQLDPFSD